MGEQISDRYNPSIQLKVNSDGSIINSSINLEVAMGNVSGMSFIEKFGRNRDVDSGTEEPIWDGAGAYTFSTVADIDSISSSEVADRQTLEIQGLDSSWDLVVQEKALTGSTTATLDTPLIRVFRAKNVSDDALTGDAYVYVDSTTAGGIPSDAAKVRAKILAGVNQTNMAIYTVPNAKTGYLTKWYASILRSSGVTGVAADVDIFRRELNGVFRSTQPIGIQNTGLGVFQYEFPYPLSLAAKTDIVVRAIPTAAADVSAGFTILLEDD